MLYTRIYTRLFAKPDTNGKRRWCHKQAKKPDSDHFISMLAFGFIFGWAISPYLTECSRKR